MKRVIKKGCIMRPRKESLIVDVNEYIHGIVYGSESTDFLILGDERMKDRLITKTDEFLGKPYKVVRVDVIDVDGVPTTAFRVNRKYTNHLLRQNTVHTIYNALAQFFTDDDIRTVFNRLWVEERNFLAREENRKAYNRCHGHFARSSQDNRHIHHITTGMSAREAARQSI